MEITEVRIKLMESSEDRLRGFCSITFDSCFVVRDLKIIDGNSGPFVAMPSRKLTSNCSKCHTKNHMRANYCNQCGQKLRHARPQQGPDGRAKLYADIAHPINAKCREMIQNRVIEELEKEQQLSRSPGYRSRYDESYDSGPNVTADEIEKDNSGNDAANGRNESDSKPKTRTDAAHRDPPKPHAKPDRPTRPAGEEDDSDAPKGRDGDFGEGIFD
ncbi:SpoVG family protein [Mariniblastus fucicola]|uniref:Septation protein SpoVG n=1 Tax=Mariniblastus fucicola TaxID=980251 RepID=A0A5B9P8G7_9BACT|nr:SpoVG family protein [Mariniblastus fucicola]QEG21202.1 Putative septation protein SpoVG [Mariniblastus fucicola]